jgi:carbon storage regulator CsrA
MRPTDHEIVNLLTGAAAAIETQTSELADAHRVRGKWDGCERRDGKPNDERNRTMLVLTRKDGEKIRLPELGITIWVLPRDGHQTRIGIEAPREIRVIRGELEDRQKPPVIDTTG